MIYSCHKGLTTKYSITDCFVAHSAFYLVKYLGRCLVFNCKTNISII